jgi:hypothetical protein
MRTCANPHPCPRLLQVSASAQQRVGELSEEAARLRRAAAALNHPDTFAQSAKAERKAIALEREGERIRAVETAVRGGRAMRAVQVGKHGLYIDRILLMESIKAPHLPRGLHE